MGDWELWREEVTVVGFGNGDEAGYGCFPAAPFVHAPAHGFDGDIIKIISGP